MNSFVIFSVHSALVSAAPYRLGRRQQNGRLWHSLSAHINLEFQHRLHCTPTRSHPGDIPLDFTCGGLSILSWYKDGKWKWQSSPSRYSRCIYLWVRNLGVENTRSLEFFDHLRDKFQKSTCAKGIRWSSNVTGLRHSEALRPLGSSTSSVV